MFHLTDSRAESVSRETGERLRLYESLVLKWNRAINLVSKSDEGQLWERHIQDCLDMVPHIPSGSTRLIDMGSGSGLPGLVLAIATGLHADLIESDVRKAVFLREAARLTEAPVTVHSCRLEAARLPRSNLVTARALARLDQLLIYTEQFLEQHGVGLFPKGDDPEPEIIQCALSWDFDVSVTKTSIGSLVAIRNLRRIL